MLPTAREKVANPSNRAITVRFAFVFTKTSLFKIEIVFHGDLLIRSEPALWFPEPDAFVPSGRQLPLVRAPTKLVRQRLQWSLLSTDVGGHNGAVGENANDCFDVVACLSRGAMTRGAESSSRAAERGVERSDESKIG